MLLIILSNQLPIVGLVRHYHTNYLIRRGPISCQINLSPSGHIRYYPQFPRAIPEQKARSHALLTRPPLTPKGPLDLHVLSLPPAFVLSQDQTLKLNMAVAMILDA